MLYDFLEHLNVLLLYFPHLQLYIREAVIIYCKMQLFDDEKNSLHLIDNVL